MTSESRKREQDRSPTTDHGSLIVVAYNRRRATALLVEWTSQDLLDEVRAGTFACLGNEQVHELEEVALAWAQRAMGELTLRDALLIDPTRGAVAWSALCAWQVFEQCELPNEEAPPSIFAICAQGGVLEGTDIGAITASHPRMTQLLAAYDDGSALAAWPAAESARYALPAQLELLLPPEPVLHALPLPRFEQPVGARRVIATVLAGIGTGLVGLPLLVGQTPTEPARLPLALITLALLVGIRARFAGYLGSLCIWLVANLPGFHHGNLHTLWPALPLLSIGLLLLMMDPRVRAMWRWIRGRMKNEV